MNFLPCFGHISLFSSALICSYIFINSWFLESFESKSSSFQAGHLALSVWKLKRQSKQKDFEQQLRVTVCSGFRVFSHFSQSNKGRRFGLRAFFILETTSTLLSFRVFLWALTILACRSFWASCLALSWALLLFGRFHSGLWGIGMLKTLKIETSGWGQQLGIRLKGWFEWYLEHWVQNPAGYLRMLLSWVISLDSFTEIVWSLLWGLSVDGCCIYRFVEIY